MQEQSPPAERVRTLVEEIRMLIAHADPINRVRMLSYIETLLSPGTKYREDVSAQNGETKGRLTEQFTPPSPAAREFKLKLEPRAWPEEPPERPAAIRDEILLKIGATGSEVSTTAILRYLETRGLEIDRSALSTILNRMKIPHKSMGHAIHLKSMGRGFYSLAPDGERRFEEIRHSMS